MQPPGVGVKIIIVVFVCQGMFVNNRIESQIQFFWMTRMLMDKTCSLGFNFVLCKYIYISIIKIPGFRVA